MFCIQYNLEDDERILNKIRTVRHDPEENS